jgi:16S rRNA (guanine527-N7)-methyltransferase
MFQELLAREFNSAALSPQQLALLEAHYDLMLRWNQRLNLTRILSLEDAVRFHYCESLFLGTLLPPGELTIADVGSGAGFPGIPLAILRPECRMTLIESHQRKAVFLREASRELKNVSVLAIRAQDVKQHFDWTVSRAVSPQEVIKLSLSPSMALLMGQDDASELRDPWKITPLPWGKARVAAIRVG